MELVIKIDDQTYNNFVRNEYSRADVIAIHTALVNGTPQKTGHWIRWYEVKETSYGTEHTPHCKCSECGKEFDPYASRFVKFCDECGAKMVEPQERNEIADYLVVYYESHKNRD